MHLFLLRSSSYNRIVFRDMHVCIKILIHVRMYVYMHLYMHACMHEDILVMNTCIHACTYRSKIFTKA